MSMSTWIILGLTAYVAMNLGLSFYKSFHAPRCPPGASTCLSPLFVENEPIGLWVYLTVDPKLKWWTAEGFQELQAVPLWNKTGLPYGEQAAHGNATILPLSNPALQGVRANTSTLYAHCFITRGNISLVDAITTAGLRKRPAHGVLSEDVVHARRAITKLLPQTKRARRSLLGNASADASSSDEGAAVTEEGQAVLVHPPLLGRPISVYPSESLTWVIAAFSLTAFFQPGARLAAGRHVLLVGLTPWLMHLRREEQARLKEARRQEALKDAAERKAAGPDVPMPHLTPKVRIELAVDTEQYDPRYAPPLLYKALDFGEGGFGGSSLAPMEIDVRYPVILVGDKGAKRYAPPFQVDLWGFQGRYWRPLDANASKPDPDVPLELVINGMMRYSVTETFKQSLRMYTQFGIAERDLDDIRDWLFRYPLHIMALMQFIGIVQMLLTTLAFKNDITFFKGRSDYTGLSSRSLMTDTMQEVIIFLYLFDYEEISRIVLFQVGTSALIGAWKYARVARLSITLQYWLPWVASTRGQGGNEEEQTTEDIDAKGMRYLKYFLYPLSAVWGIYNLYYYEYKSWWSWLVSSLADFAYTFGFINMMPQIFINYKLKSVAHMPWRVLMYKFFNTFIDDFFAFFIMSEHMTKKHRFMTLRDDIVFFVFLYQRHLYKVDPTRPDEFGYVYDEAKSQASSKEVEDKAEHSLEGQAAEGDAKAAGSSDEGAAANDGGEDAAALGLGPAPGVAPGAGAEAPEAEAPEAEAPEAEAEASDAAPSSGDATLRRRGAGAAAAPVGSSDV